MNALSDTPARRSTEVDSGRRGALAITYTAVIAARAPHRLAMATGEMGPHPVDTSKKIASVAPSDAPAETPSVSGAASGFRKSACSTVPAVASAAPTTTPDSTRG